MTAADPWLGGSPEDGEDGEGGDCGSLGEGQPTDQVSLVSQNLLHRGRSRESSLRTPRVQLSSVTLSKVVNSVVVLLDCDIRWYMCDVVVEPQQVYDDVVVESYNMYDDVVESYNMCDYVIES